MAGTECLFEFEFDAATGQSGGRWRAESGVETVWGELAAANAAAHDCANAATGSDSVISSPPKRAPPILGYHFSMVNDVARASAFKRGLADIITPASIVVDLGSGSGLLAVLAAKLGARHVFAIEQESSLADVSRQVMIENNVSHRVTVLNRWGKLCTI